MKMLPCKAQIDQQGRIKGISFDLRNMLGIQLNTQMDVYPTNKGILLCIPQKK